MLTTGLIKQSGSGDGQRATATTGTQQFAWDTVTAVPQALMDSQNAYIYCGGLAPAEQVNLTTGTVTYLVADSLGSVRGTVSASGSLTGTTSYDAWGNSETAGGLTATTPFGYAGGYTDPTGLIYLVTATTTRRPASSPRLTRLSRRPCSHTPMRTGTR
jgi:hypothetical protein